MNQYFFEDISVGMSESQSRDVTETLVNSFADVSGDNNPLHVDADYAAASRFKQRIAHGALSSAFISAVLGTGLPGLGTIYMTQSVRFLAPIHLGDTVETIVTATVCNKDNNRITFDTSCYVKDKKVVEGEAMVYVPSRPEVLS